MTLRLSILILMISTWGSSALSGDLQGSVTWSVGLTLQDVDPVCSSAALSLRVLTPEHDGVSQFDVPLATGRSDWIAPVDETGIYIVLARVTNCAGIARETDAIDLVVRDVHEDRWITLFAYMMDGDFGLSHLGSCRDRSAETLLEATPEDPPVLRNVSSTTVRRCPSNTSIRVEYLIDGEWTTSYISKSFDWPGSVDHLGPGRALTSEEPRVWTINLSSPDQPKPVVTARRLLVRLLPDGKCNASTSTTPKYTVTGFDCCDIAYLPWPKAPQTRQKESD
jgi:hypothetical protein